MKLIRQALFTHRERAELFRKELAYQVKKYCKDGPAYGAKIAETILADPDLRRWWKDTLTYMAGRIKYGTYITTNTYVKM